MAVALTKWDEARIAQHFKEGRGHGTRESYMPWLYVREFSSKGNSTRVPSLLFPRTIQTFSYLERYMYLYLEFKGGILDYREQFPMDRKVTQRAARRLRVRHPRYPETKVPMVMNVDALVTRKDKKVEVWDAKPTYHLVEKRTQDKLKLHKAYADHMGFDYHLFTEASVPKQVLRNIDLIRSALPKTGELLRPVDLFSMHLPLVKQAVVRPSRMTLQSFCLNYDRANKLPLGSTLRLVWCLLWSRQLETNLDVAHLHLTPLCAIHVAVRPDLH